MSDRPSYSLALSDALESAASLNPETFCRGGLDFAGAVQRESFVRLVNDPDLVAAYHAGRGSVSVGDEFEAAAVRIVAPGAVPRVSAVQRLRALVGPLAAAARARGQAAVHAERRPIVIVAHHPKFVRFVAPVVLALGAENVGVLALSPLVLESARSLGLGATLLGRTSERAPELGSRSHLTKTCWAIRGHLDDAGARAVVTLEGNASTDELARLAADSLGLASVCIQHGWAAEPNIGFRNFRYTAFAVWGDGFAELYAPHSPGQRFVATGDPALDAVAHLADEVPPRPAVLFALQTVAPTISRRAMEEFVRLAAATADACPDLTVLVRQHPGHPLERLGLSVPARTNIRLVDAPGVSLAEALAASTAVASISSTTLLEGVALLRPALVYRGDGPPYSPDLPAAGVGIEATTTAAAIEAARALTSQSERQARRAAMESFGERFFAGMSGDAAARAAELIRSVAS